MPKQWWLKVLAYLLLILVLVNLDQLAKNYFSSHDPITVGNWLDLHLVINTGSAFSLQVPLWLTAVLGLFLGVYGLLVPIYLKRVRVKFSWPLLLLLALLAAGVWGNTIDRLVYGGVIDFIDLGWWPVFNIADSYLVVGVIICVIWQLYTSYQQSLTKK